MTNGGEYSSYFTDNGNITTTNAGDYPYYYEYTTPDYEMPQTVSIPYAWKCLNGSVTKVINPKGGDDMRYLYKVILVNPKNDTWYKDTVVAKSETSAIMKAYSDSQFNEALTKGTDFDDLKTSCRVLMEWKKEKSLKKAIETIEEAVE